MTHTKYIAAAILTLQIFFIIGLVGVPRQSHAVMVPVQELGTNLVENTLNTIETIWQTLKEESLDAIAWALAEQAISQMTSNMVNWINSGFDGQPAFVTNPEQFLSNIGDRAFFEFTDEYLETSDQPFKEQIAQSLTFSRDQGFSVDYTLDDATGGEDETEEFIRGDFSQGGWDGWFELTQNPDNNIFGSLLKTEDQASRQARVAREEEERVLDWGDGFRSFTDEEGNIRTPGTVIESQLNNALGSSVRKLEVADEFNEIISALAGQLMNSVFGGEGLLSGDTVSTADRLPTAQCSDGEDNDEDGAVDYPDDPGCSSADDRFEGTQDASEFDDEVDERHDEKSDEIEDDIDEPDLDDGFDGPVEREERFIAGPETLDVGEDDSAEFAVAGGSSIRDIVIRNIGFNQLVLQVRDGSSKMANVQIRELTPQANEYVREIDDDDHRYAIEFDITLEGRFTFYNADNPSELIENVSGTVSNPVLAIQHGRGSHVTASSGTFDRINTRVDLSNATFYQIDLRDITAQVPEDNIDPDTGEILTLEDANIEEAKTANVHARRVNFEDATIRNNGGSGGSVPRGDYVRVSTEELTTLTKFHIVGGEFEGDNGTTYTIRRFFEEPDLDGKMWAVSNTSVRNADIVNGNIRVEDPNSWWMLVDGTHTGDGYLEDQGHNSNREFSGGTVLREY